MIWIAPQNSKLSKIFDKYINVFGVHNFATAKFPCKHLKHAAGVMAQGPNSMEKIGHKNACEKPLLFKPELNTVLTVRF